MVRRAAIVAAVQQGQRQRLRRKLGALETSLVKRITFDRYTEFPNSFGGLSVKHGQTWPVCTGENDSFLSEYCGVVWDQGEPNVATYTLASLH